MKGHNGKSEWENENNQLKRTKKCDYAIVFQIRGDRIIETKNKGDHVGLAIAYWLLPTTFALSHYCQVENQKSFFKIESEIIKDDKRKLLFSSQKS